MTTVSPPAAPPRVDLRSGSGETLLGEVLARVEVALQVGLDRGSWDPVGQFWFTRRW